MLKSASSYLILLGVIAVIVGITTGIELRRSGPTLDQVLDHAG